MKSLKLSLALVVSLGLSSVALADHAANGCCAPDPCCGHGLLSRLKLHRCDPCAEAKPCAPKCEPKCDPCCGGHKLMGMLKCIHLPKLGHGCCDAAPCAPKCEPKPCAPKCCAPKPCAPKCCAPKPCAPKCCKPRKCCPAPKCEPCETACCVPVLDRIKGHLHRSRCCEAPKCEPKCEPKCDSCCGHHFSLHKLFGKHCCPCDGAAVEAPAAAPAAAPAPAPKPMGASSNGLLILTPAG